MAQIYASDTRVPVAQTKGDIERILERYGADSFGYAYDAHHAMVQFRAQDRMVRFTLAMPDEQEYRVTPQGRSRDATATRRAWEQAYRSRWRALFLVIKAKLEAVESGIAEFEDEFLAQILLPDDKTVAEFIRPQLDEAYRTGLMPTTFKALESGR